MSLQARCPVWSCVAISLSCLRWRDCGFYTSFLTKQVYWVTKDSPSIRSEPSNNNREHAIYKSVTTTYAPPFYSDQLSATPIYIRTRVFVFWTLTSDIVSCLHLTGSPLPLTLSDHCRSLCCRRCSFLSYRAFRRTWTMLEIWLYMYDNRCSIPTPIWAIQSQLQFVQTGTWD